MVKKYSLKKDGERQLSKHFKVKEFRSKDGCDTVLINADLVDVLEQLFNTLGAAAININSGYRTNSHSVAVGGYAGDQHTKGNAADIWAKRSDGSTFTSKEITLALEDMNHQGGVGLINKDRMVHVDVRGKKTWFDETNHEKAVSSWYKYWGEPIPKHSSEYTPYVLTCGMLKVRKAPSTLSKRVGEYYKGQTFFVKKWQGNWCQLKSGNWMCAKKYCRRAK